MPAMTEGRRAAPEGRREAPGIPPASDRFTSMLAQYQRK
jgi:hypothetical protein